MGSLVEKQLYLPGVVVPELQPIILVVATRATTGHIDILAACGILQLEAEIVQVGPIVDILIHSVLCIPVVGVAADEPEFHLTRIIPVGGGFLDFIQLGQGKRKLEHLPRRRVFCLQPIGSRGWTLLRGSAE